jgi:hypothetical protein
MSAYIRSKITNTEDDIIIQLGTTTTIRTNFSDDIELDGKKIVGLAVPETNSGAATKGYVDTSIANLVDGAPLVLDTLNELADAIGNNANFVTDITASIATKLPLAGGTLTGTLILNNNPVVAMGAATKDYVDNLVDGQMIYSTDDVSEGSNLYYTTTRARGAISAGSGISYDSNTGVITNTITQYADTLARSAISAGAGISYDSNTGVITNTITQYSDTLARGAISVGGSLSYDNTTGVISYTTPVTNINSLSDVDTVTRGPVVGEALVWDGSNWVPGASVTAVLADASLDGGSFD